MDDDIENSENKNAKEEPQVSVSLRVRLGK
jgi:hypothetical protein